jgi:hypothetical protein
LRAYAMAASRLLGGLLVLSSYTSLRFAEFGREGENPLKTSRLKVPRLRLPSLRPPRLRPELRTPNEHDHTNQF